MLTGLHACFPEDVDDQRRPTLMTIARATDYSFVLTANPSSLTFDPLGETLIDARSFKHRG